MPPGLLDLSSPSATRSLGCPPSLNRRYGMRTAHRHPRYPMRPTEVLIVDSRDKSLGLRHQSPWPDPPIDGILLVGARLAPVLTHPLRLSASLERIRATLPARLRTKRTISKQFIWIILTLDDRLCCFIHLYRFARRDSVVGRRSSGAVSVVRLLVR